MRGGEPVARLVSVASAEPRQLGIDRGRFLVPEDFGVPLPDDRSVSEPGPRRSSPTRDQGLLLSAASAWEIAIKYALGRLPLPEPPPALDPDRMRASGVTGLAVDHAHAHEVAHLPLHHGDPFDRLLIAQAKIEAVPLITADAAFGDYDVNLIVAGA